MLSKCANPDCSSVFHYLHQGKIFLVTKVAATHLSAPSNGSLATERFWLCDACSRKMRIAWDGCRVQLIRLQDTQSAKWRAAQSVPRREYQEIHAAAEMETEHGTAVATEAQGKEGFMAAVAELNPKETGMCFHHILVATDFSEASRRALSDALALATRYEAPLSVLHVIPPELALINLESPRELDMAWQTAQRKMKEFLSDIGPHHNIEHIFLRSGPLSKVVESVIGEAEIDLLVIGTRGRGGLRKLALGSMAEQLLRLASCPVLTVGPKADGNICAGNATFGTILFATDFGPGSRKVLPVTLALVEANQAKLILLHMVPPTVAAGEGGYAYSPAAAMAEELQGWKEAARAESLKRLKNCLPTERKLAQAPEYIVETEFLPEGVLRAAEVHKADLIVMGANRAFSARAAAHNPWSLVHEVVVQAACPVLTVADVK